MPRNSWLNKARALAHSRAGWLLAGAAALGLEVFSVLFFQGWLRLKPCELCVYIRFSMLVMAVGAFIVAAGPRTWLCRVPGWALFAYGAVRGLMWDIALEGENLAAGAEESVCSLAGPHFPLGLPLARWLPRHFTPLAMCGQDSAWSFLGLNMAEWLFCVYGAFLIFLLLALWPWRPKASPARL